MKGITLGEHVVKVYVRQVGQQQKQQQQQQQQHDTCVRSCQALLTCIPWASFIGDV